jgi:class 3 adenylate cyclase/tetratricopeptide (TPR) repeat protein
MRCPSCDTENEPGRKFCGECGSPLASICASCGTSNSPGNKFCGECGAALKTIEAGSRTSNPPMAEPATRRPAAASERRLVSVLFADLVGFTARSESKDPEEVRELLTSYFDVCRTLIARYGGTVEKFIGDAVMAVWGTPVATEDDAERAVRAALELTAAVSTLGEEANAPDLKARAGVCTGEVAVTIGAEGQGMVAGDLVNTASRVQAEAEPGSVLVGEATRRATQGSVVYDDAGAHELKGKAEPMRLWRAVRVVAGSRGILKSVGLEAPFVGRDRELRLIKDLFHSSATEGTAQLVSVLGVAGLGKSRLVWEFFKYIDGLADMTFWHRGRCLAYGEGVTYWALAEMVKSRARILEDEEPGPASTKLHKVVEDLVPDPEEQRWIEPRLAHLLGLEERTVRDREELFSAWRLFFERMSERDPTVLVFEDLHWADPSLIDFIEHLLDWSRSRRIFVLTFARPELMDRFPGWGGGKRNFTSISLDPLPDTAMVRMLSGLVPGLPDELRERILERAEGVPLYAVETVRMLLDRELLVQEGSVYRPTGPIDTLEVPESLQALISARLDGLSVDERRLLQDASVIGKTFSREALSAVSGEPEDAVDLVVSALVRKEVLGAQVDPFSPERGQYGFLQDLIRKVAYETLSKRDRKARHLAAAAFLETTGDEEDAVEVVAAHYVEAYRVSPEADDALAIKTKARQQLIRAGDRAASLAAREEAQRYFEQAAELADEELEKASLIERAGEMALGRGRGEVARRLLESALKMFQEGGHPRPAARVSARLAETDWIGGRLDEAVARMEDAFKVLEADEPGEDLATLAAQLGRLHFFRGEHGAALERVDFALRISEALVLPEVLSQSLNTKGIVALSSGLPEEALALIGHALKVALDHDLSSAALRAYLNMAETLGQRDRYEEGLDLYRDALVLARRVGDRFWERQCLAEAPYALFMVGRWQEALDHAAEIPEEEMGGADVLGILMALPTIHTSRGSVEDAERVIELFRDYEGSEDVQEVSAHAAAKGMVRLHEGKYEEALALAEEALRVGLKMGPDNQMVKSALDQIADSAMALGDLARVDSLLEMMRSLQPSAQSPFIRATTERTAARLAAAKGEHRPAELYFKSAVGMFRESGLPFFLAKTLLEYGDWLGRLGRPEQAGPLLSEADSLFDGLGASVWRDRVDAMIALGVADVGAS